MAGGGLPLEVRLVVDRVPPDSESANAVNADAGSERPLSVGSTRVAQGFNDRSARCLDLVQHTRCGSKGFGLTLKFLKSLGVAGLISFMVSVIWRKNPKATP